MAKLKELKLKFGEAPAAPPPAKSGNQGEGGGGGKLILKTAKGTRDYQPAQMAVREKVKDVEEFQDLPTALKSWSRIPVIFPFLGF